MEVFLVYLWLQLNGIKIMLAALALVLFIFAIGWAVYMSDAGRWEEKTHTPKLKRKFLNVLGLCVLAFAIPNSNTMAYMVATHYAVAFGQSPEAQKVVSLLRKKANEILDEELKAK